MMGKVGHGSKSCGNNAYCCSDTGVQGGRCSRGRDYNPSRITVRSPLVARPPGPVLRFPHHLWWVAPPKLLHVTPLPQVHQAVPLSSGLLPTKPSPHMTLINKNRSYKRHGTARYQTSWCRPPPSPTTPP